MTIHFSSMPKELSAVPAPMRPTELLLSEMRSISGRLEALNNNAADKLAPVLCQSPSAVKDRCLTTTSSFGPFYGEAYCLLEAISNKLDDYERIINDTNV